MKLMLAGNVVKCAVSDNGSASNLFVHGRGLTIVGELASSLGGRVHASCAAEGASFLLTFPLTESEQHAAGATHAVLKRRRCVVLTGCGSEKPKMQRLARAVVPLKQSNHDAKWRHSEQDLPPLRIRIHGWSCRTSRDTTKAGIAVDI